MRVGLSRPSDLMSIVCGGDSAALLSSNNLHGRILKAHFCVMAAALEKEASEDEMGGVCLVLVNLWLLRRIRIT